MASLKQEGKHRLSQSQRAEALREIHFPGKTPPLIWNRRVHDGYTTIPRTLPIVMQAIDAQCKGQPAGHVLFCLWARSWDSAMVIVDNQATFAAEAGFSGERAIDTWRKRMKHLKRLNFIDTTSGASGDFHHVLLINPNLAMERLRRNDQVNDATYGRFIDRIHEVGAKKEFDEIKNSLDSAEPEQVTTTSQDDRVA